MGAVENNQRCRAPHCHQQIIRRADSTWSWEWQKQGGEAPGTVLAVGKGDTEQIQEAVGCRPFSKTRGTPWKEVSVHLGADEVIGMTSGMEQEALLYQARC